MTYSFSYLEPVCCSMSSSNSCFLTCIQISQEAGQVVWYCLLFQNFPQFIVIHTVKGFGIVNKTEIDVFLELSCFFHDPSDVGKLISGSSAFSKTSLNIRRFTVHVLLKPGLENFEDYFTSMCNCVVPPNSINRLYDTYQIQEGPFIHLGQLHRKIKGFMSQLVGLSTWVMKVEESTGCFLTWMAEFQHLLLLMWYNHIQLNSEYVRSTLFAFRLFYAFLMYSTVQFHNAVNS